MSIKKGMCKVYNFYEIKDEFIGKKGSPARKKYESALKLELIKRKNKITDYKTSGKT